jgi:NTP pyrophosphatase (non-canonical NTP hydrolase)
VSGGMKMTNNQKIAKIANLYGIDSQLIQLNEECGELIQAASKILRMKYGQPLRKQATEDEAIAALLEEMADVTIVIKELTTLLDGDAAIENIITEKLDRTIAVDERLK